MVQLTFSKRCFLLLSIHFLVTLTNGENFESDAIDIGNKFSSTLLSTFEEEMDSNGVRNLVENQPKSRRKRFVAFPEGSSFSVNFIQKKKKTKQ